MPREPANVTPGTQPPSNATTTARSSDYAKKTTQYACTYFPTSTPPALPDYTNTQIGPHGPHRILPPTHDPTHYFKWSPINLKRATTLCYPINSARSWAPDRAPTTPIPLPSPSMADNLTQWYRPLWHDYKLFTEMWKATGTQCSSEDIVWCVKNGSAQSRGAMFGTLRKVLSMIGRID